MSKHDLKKKHKGRRKKGQKKRRKMWLVRHKKRFNKPTSKRRTRKQLWSRRSSYRRLYKYNGPQQCGSF